MLDLLGARSKSPIASSAKQIVSAAILLCKLPATKCLDIPSELNLALRKIQEDIRPEFPFSASYFKANTDGSYIGILQEGQKGRKYVARISIFCHEKVERHIEGIKSFPHTKKIKIPDLIVCTEIDGIKISVETGLERPFLHSLGIPSYTFLSKAWSDFIRETATLGNFADSSYEDSVVGLLRGRIERLPKWLVNWITSNDYVKTFRAIGITPIGLLHGDLDIKNCWRLGDDLYLVDFDRHQKKAPMLIDIVRAYLYRDLRHDLLLKRVSLIIREGFPSLHDVNFEYDISSYDKAVQLKLLYLTLLHQYAEGIERGYSDDSQEMIILIDAAFIVFCTESFA